ncbi:MAG: hypothetical protein ACFFHD_13320 [Promethearchaeota archaeon]
MSNKKLYFCRECGYEFPPELSNLIDQKIQVYCERCGSPFVLEGINFRPATPYAIRDIKPTYISPKKEYSSLDKFIQFLNKISFIPLFIFTTISFGLIAEIAIDLDNWFFIFIDHFFQGLIGLILLIYDRAYIAPKVKEKKYNEIFLDSFCWGILGCILYGTGVIILIKGIFIIFYVISAKENKDLRSYDYGLLAKNSINYFSAKAGFFIILIAIYRIIIDGNYLGNEFNGYFPFIGSTEIIIVFIVLFWISVIALFIDNKIKSKIREKNKFELNDSITIFFLGILGVLFCAAGIFVLLKGILLFFLLPGKPSEPIQSKASEERPVYITPIYEQRREITPQPEELEIEKITQPVIIKAPIEEKSKSEIIDEVPVKKLEEKEEIKVIEKKKEKEREEIDYKLKLHESLLPVKDEKDKKLVKQYFTKIFSVLSNDLRKQILDLKIPKKERKELLKELAFLTKEEQIKYVEALINLYREIPKKLIARIRRLPNVKPEHYSKIIDQLKYLDYEEQIQFVQFLEENA